MSFEVTVTPTVYDVEVDVNPSVQPFDVEVTVGNVPDLDLTTNGDSGASTFDPLTGELNIPNYTLDGLGGVPESRTITINGTTQDLSANRTFSIPTHDAVTIGSPANGLAIDGNQVLTIGLASSGANGALSSTDWSTFNNKQNALGFTPEDVANKSTDTGLGTSNSLYPSQGAVKSYIDTGLSGKENTLGFTPENVANKSINLTLPDDTKYPTTLAVSTALAGKQDLLTNPITGTGTAGQVSFWNGTSTQTGDSGLFWDDTNKRLGIGTNTPNSLLHITGSNTASGGTARGLNIIPTLVASANNDNLYGIDISPTFNNGAFTGVANRGIVSIVNTNAIYNGIFIRNNSNGTAALATISVANNLATAAFSVSGSGNTVLTPNQARLRSDSDIANGFNFMTGGSTAPIIFSPADTERMRIFASSGNLGIGTGAIDAGFRLDVNGNARIRNGVSLADISGNVQIGTLTDAGFRLDVNGTARVNLTNSSTDQLNIGGYNNRGVTVGHVSLGGIFGFQLNNDIVLASSYGTALHINSRYNGTNYISNNSFVRPQILLLRNGDFTFSNSPATTQGNNITLTDVLTIKGTGNVLINTTTDTGFRLDVNGTARVQGAITTGAPTGGTAKPFKIGAVATVTPILPNRTIEIEIDGTTYYLTAKTTND